MATEAVADDEWENQIVMYEPESVQVVDVSEYWYLYMKYYLSIGDILVGLDSHKWRELCLKSARYQLVSSIMF